MGDKIGAVDPLDQIFRELESIKRALDGDAVQGWPGLRQRIQAAEECLKVERAEREKMQWRLALATGALKWLGPSGVILLLGFIGYVLRTAGTGV